MKHWLLKGEEMGVPQTRHRVFFIAVRTMQLTGFSTKYGKIAKIVGGILLFIIGILLIFKPEWIMFNF